MLLDISPLGKAITQTEKSLKYCESDFAKSDLQLAFQLRAGAIQAFEFTYELAIKTLKRYLEQTETTAANIDHMSFNALIRLGFERGLLKAELVGWKKFRDRRNITSHTYDEKKAQVVYETIPLFLIEAKFLHTEITKRQQHEEASLN